MPLVTETYIPGARVNPVHTVRVKHADFASGYILINAAEFDAKVHTLYSADDKPAVAAAKKEKTAAEKAEQRTAEKLIANDE